MKNSFKLIVLFFQTIPFLFGVEFVSFGNDISEIAGDAKHTAMGGVGLAIDSESSLFKNPSLVIFNNKNNISISRDSHWNGLVNHTQFVYNPKQKDKYFTSFGMIIRSIDDIHNTENAWIDQGTAPNGDINYENIDFSNHQEFLCYISFSTKIKKNAKISSIGISLKPKLALIDDYYSVGFGFDVGVYSPLTKNLSIGYFIQDVFSVNYWNTGNIQLNYPKFKIGIYEKTKYINLGIDIGKSTNTNEKIEFATGVEIQMLDGFQFFLGSSSTINWSLGFSTRTRFIDFIYSVNQNRVLSEVAVNHKISLIFDIKKVSKLSEGLRP
jgi:hypothetical protein